MTGLDRFMTLDTATGILRAEAGVTLGEIMRRVVPQGFFLPVTPGTRSVTLGGAIANDVHGKNHHCAGTFGRHVSSCGLFRHEGEAITATAGDNDGLFGATIGGLGLTGLIEWAEIKLQPIKSSLLDVDIIPYEDLSEFWDIAGASNGTHEHTVAWIDCTTGGRRAGRGIFSRANWSCEGGLVLHNDDKRLHIPIDAPNGLLNRQTVGAFNQLYHAAQRRKAGSLRQHYSHFFHPLDGIANWNRLYGRRGFWQYQCVVPKHSMREAIAELLKAIIASGQASFLTVLKTFGGLQSPGLLSFPMEGATLALDFCNRGTQTLALFERLDAIVREAKGRLYAAKDGRIPKDMWAIGYPELERFLTYADPNFSSDFWRRVQP
jgi:L-gulonolactone oxidase